MNLPQVARFCQYRGFLTASVKQRKGAGGSCSAAGARTGPLICTSARRPPQPAPDSGGSGDTSATHYRAPHPLKSGLKNISGPGLHKTSPLRNDPPPDRSSRALALRNGVAVLIRLAVPLCSADRFLTRLHQCPGHRETRAMGFLATSRKPGRPAPSRRPLRPRLDTPSAHDRDAAAAATRVPGTPSLAEGPRCRRGRLRIQAAPGERPSTRRCAAARDRHHPERNLPISGPAGSLRVIFHTVAAHAPLWPSEDYCTSRQSLRLSIRSPC